MYQTSIDSYILCRPGKAGQIPGQRLQEDMGRLERSGASEDREVRFAGEGERWLQSHFVRSAQSQLPLFRRIHVSAFNLCM